MGGSSLRNGEALGTHRGHPPFHVKHYEALDTDGIFQQWLKPQPHYTTDSLSTQQMLSILCRQFSL